MMSATEAPIAIAVATKVVHRANRMAEAYALDAPIATQTTFPLLLSCATL
jgi:hypothetical protein